MTNWDLSLIIFGDWTDKGNVDIKLIGEGQRTSQWSKGLQSIIRVIKNILSEKVDEKLYFLQNVSMCWIIE